MKKIIILLVIPAFFVFSSCNKLSTINGMPLPISSNTPQIGVIQDNIQSQFGSSTPSLHVEGSGLDQISVANLSVNGLSIPQDPSTGTFILNYSDNPLMGLRSVAWNNNVPVLLNGNSISSGLSLPLAPVVNTSNISNWQVSKSNGITLNFTPVNSSPFVQNDGENSVLSTVVAIAPTNLSTSQATSQYWIIDNSSTSFTIPASALANYANNESMDITIGSGVTDQIVYSGQNVNLFTASITHLPAITVTNSVTSSN